ncbi:MAG: hypothetical protein EKK37_16300 [Sphingobacteriales bacterium]|nr:MAG: hypothetical protein EKK37_16300 [Sphingobacteriales bacterium]
MTVNSIYIDYLFGTFIGGGDSEEDVDNYSLYNPNNESDVKKLAKEVLLPEFQSQNINLITEVKNSLAYYLTYDKIDFKDKLNSLLLPIKTPDNPKLFFKWIWEIFFKDELIDYIKNETVIEDFDINAPYKLLTSSPNSA